MGAGGIAAVWEAVFADVGVAVLAILNAIRAMKAPPAAKSDHAADQGAAVEATAR